MPSWPTHLKIARTINKKLQVDENAFILGNIMPDILSGFIIPDVSMQVSPGISHYRSPYGKHHIEIEKFINNYKGKFENPVVLGYLTHLISDSLWNTWTYSNHYIEKAPHKIFMILNDNSEVPTDNKSFRKLKHNDFKTFDNYLMSTQDLGETFTLDTSILNLTQEIKEVPCTIGDIEKAVGILNNIITSTPAYTPNYKIFTEEELKRLLEHTYEHIFTILEENKIITK